MALNAERAGYEAAALLDGLMSGRIKRPATNSGRGPGGRHAALDRRPGVDDREVARPCGSSTRMLGNRSELMRCQASGRVAPRAEIRFTVGGAVDPR